MDHTEDARLQGSAVLETLGAFGALNGSKLVYTLTQSFWANGCA